MGSELKPLVERIERIQTDLEVFKEDEKEAFAEAKARGYDVKIIRKVIARRKRDRTDVEEEDAILELYEEEVGS